MADGRHNNWGRDWNVDSLRRRFWNGQSQAHAAVSQAVKKGFLKPAKEFTCSDCDNPATDYDHRDYGRPLDVEPVCRSCNLLRGKALPKRWDPEEAAKFVRDQVIKSCVWHIATKPDFTDDHHKDWHVHNWCVARKTALAHWIASRQCFKLCDAAHELFHPVEADLYAASATDEYLADPRNAWMKLTVGAKK
jgi:hypothetical protein